LNLVPYGGKIIQIDVLPANKNVSKQIKIRLSTMKHTY